MGVSVIAACVCELSSPFVQGAGGKCKHVHAGAPQCAAAAVAAAAIAAAAVPDVWEARVVGLTRGHRSAVPCRLHWSRSGPFLTRAPRPCSSDGTVESAVCASCNIEAAAATLLLPLSRQPGCCAIDVAVDIRLRKQQWSAELRPIRRRRHAGGSSSRQPHRRRPAAPSPAEIQLCPGPVACQTL